MVHRGAVTTVMGDSLGGGAGHGAGGVSPAANCPPTGAEGSCWWWRGEVRGEGSGWRLGRGGQLEG